MSAQGSAPHPRTQSQSTDEYIMFTHEQLVEFKRYFSYNQNPTEVELQALATQMNLPLESVKLWFEVQQFHVQRAKRPHIEEPQHMQVDPATTCQPIGAAPGALTFPGVPAFSRPTVPTLAPAFVGQHLQQSPVPSTSRGPASSYWGAGFANDATVYTPGPADLLSTQRLGPHGAGSLACGPAAGTFEIVSVSPHPSDYNVPHNRSTGLKADLDHPEQFFKNKYSWSGLDTPQHSYLKDLLESPVNTPTLDLPLTGQAIAEITERPDQFHSRAFFPPAVDPRSQVPPLPATSNVISSPLQTSEFHVPSRFAAAPPLLQPWHECSPTESQLPQQSSKWTLNTLPQASPINDPWGTPVWTSQATPQMYPSAQAASAPSRHMTSTTCAPDSCPVTQVSGKSGSSSPASLNLTSDPGCQVTPGSVAREPPNRKSPPPKELCELMLALGCRPRCSAND